MGKLTVKMATHSSLFHIVSLLPVLATAVVGKGMVGKVTGVVGKPVSVPCDITPPAPGDSPHLILWYKNIFGTPIYSVDGRNGLTGAKHWGDENVFGGRATFYIKEDEGSMLAYLNITDTKPSDAGPYRCRVDFWKAATRNFKIFVDLSSEVDAVNIYNEKGKLISGRIISSRINGSLKLTCKAYGGSPRPSLQWQIAGVPKLGIQTETEEINEVSTSISLNNLKMIDSGKTISCLASNNNLYPSPRAWVQLEIVLAPVRVEISRTVSTFVAGSTYNLTCQVLGSNPTPTTAIWINGTKLENIYERESTDGKIFTIVASFTPGPEHDGEFLSCRAINKYLPKEAIEDQWKVSVVYPPISFITPQHPATKAANVSVTAGDKLILGCHAYSNPKPFDFHWRHNMKSHVSSASSTSSVLILENVSPAEAGAYTCLTENLQGLGESSPVYVNVLYPPSCREASSLEVNIAVHESVDLACEMSANPGNLSFTWNTVSQMAPNSKHPVDVPASQFTQHERKSVLTLTPRTPADFGQVTCIAENSAGIGQPCVYNIIKKVKILTLVLLRSFLPLHSERVFCDKGGGQNIG